MAEEAPLCRFKRIKKTTNRGDGIFPNLTKNLDKVRRVGTLFAVQFKCRVENKKACALRRIWDK